MTALYIILAVVAVIMLLLLIPADCILEFSYNNKENNGAVIIKYAFLKFKIFPNDRVEEEVENEEETTDKEEKQEKSDILGIITLIKEVYKQLKKDILNLLDYIICHAIKIKELNVSSKFGTGNPMYTGIATGAVNAGVYNAVGWIDRRMKLEKWDVSLDADFNNACLDMGIYCKLRTNCLYVLTIGFKTVKVVLKIQKINRRIKVNDGTMIVPISKVSFGFGGGGCEFDRKKNDTQSLDDKNFGGGMGGGASVDAMAFLVINNGNVRLIPMEGGSSPVDKLIDLVPEVVDKVNGFFAERRERKAQKKAEENECADEIINQGE